MGGKRVPRLRGPKARSPILWKIYLTNAQNADMLSLRPWARGVVSVSHYVEQSFSDILNWKLPLRVRFPTSPFSNVNDELIERFFLGDPVSTGLKMAKTRYTMGKMTKNTAIQRAQKRTYGGNDNFYVKK